MKKILGLLLVFVLLVSCNNYTNTEEEPVVEDNTEVVELVELIPNYTIEDYAYVWGYSDIKHMDTFVMEPIYDKAWPFNDDELAIVKKNNRYAIINKDNEFYVDFGVYDLITSYKNYFLASVGDHVDILKDKKTIGSFTNRYNANEKFGQLFITGEKNLVLDETSDQLVEIELTDDYDKNELIIKNYNKVITMAFDEEKNQYYFMKDDQIIGDYYDYAEPFENGYAIVGQKMTGVFDYLYIFEYALMDETGQLVIPMDHVSLKALGGGYYSFSKTASFSEDDMYILPYATKSYKQGIYKGSDKIIEEKYFDIEYINNDLFNVYDGKNYYFINSYEKRQYDSLILYGDYSFKQVGDAIVGDYYDSKVFILKDEWVLDNFISSFDQGYMTQAADIFSSKSVTYPVLHLNDTTIANKINRQISEDFAIQNKIPQEIFYESSELNVSLTVDYQIAVVDGFYFSYGFGAAHGNYAESTDHYSMLTGEKLALDDLFIDDYKTIIPLLLATYEHEDPYFYVDLNTMSIEEKIEYFTMEDYNFKLENNTLTIYFNPYEIAPYAAGIVSFEFNINDMDTIDFEGPFFK